ncbi:MFS transporter [Penicillium canariense]|uniref:MFS transporter n=1 Tax=Penicillium canariense TaxID=189055 RepID=A0A9W9LCV9_9EURO|nr:MFS transporter [Penicillium canariense]KAJ5151101.1 MFS transporter [Penicillium canariense]
MSPIFLCALSAVYLGTAFQPCLRAAVFLTFFYIFWWYFFVDATRGSQYDRIKILLVLMVPSVFYIAAIYFLFRETKGRTLEEIGALFGDTENVVSYWYDATEEERKIIAHESFRDAGDNSDDAAPKPAVLHAELC